MKILKNLISKIPSSRKFQSFLLLVLLSFTLLICNIGGATFLQWTGFILALFGVYTGGNLGEHHIKKDKS